MSDAKQLSDVPLFGPIPKCQNCSFNCCGHVPGFYHPQQLGATLAHVKARVVELLLAGQHALDWWEGDIEPSGAKGRILMLRPATQGKEGEPADPSWGGTCTFLSPTGCVLAHQRRPLHCLALEPGPTKCISHWSKPDAAWAWRPYSETMEEVLDSLET